MITFVLISLIMFTIGLHIYGVILGFRKSLWLGILTLFVPTLATAIGAAKVIFKKDL